MEERIEEYKKYDTTECVKLKIDIMFES